MTQPMTGAMVALVPSDADLQRLALPGGEPVDQLHLTLVYLGEADQIDEATRQALIAAGQDTAVGWNGVAAEAFAPALFNPTGDEPCAVLICSGAELAEIHETVVADVTEIVNLPDDLHAPWIPHVTLGYLADEVYDDPEIPDPFFSEAAIRTGPLTFDKLRFAFGGEVTDVPLTPAKAPDAVVEETPDDAPSGAAPEPALATVVSAANTLWSPELGRVEFHGCLRCFGPAHDGQCPPAL